jgi:ATP phosphoribosyltransferase regulatory subunit
MHAWLLPEYIEDVLPPEAWKIERVRRRLLDLFHSHGYEFVIPPLLEYLPSLLTGTGSDMDLKTFKLVDQLTGQLMGLRADITPQAARIDAHLLNRQDVVRLSYTGSVVHSLPNGLAKNREPLQIGAELFGHSGIESDGEIQQLMLKSLQLLGIEHIHLDLGHVGIFRSLIAAAGLNSVQEKELFEALQSKDAAAIGDLTRNCPSAICTALRALPELYGGVEVLEEARSALPNHDEIASALNQLATLGQQAEGMVGDVCFDLAELRGYHYHSGVVFSAYTRERAHAVALGGRYDEVGKVFGRSRPATGFSMDLRVLAALAKLAAEKAAILAPATGIKLQEKIETLRAAGEVVVIQLPGVQVEERGFRRRLELCDGEWQVIDL